MGFNPLTLFMLQGAKDTLSTKVFTEVNLIFKEYTHLRPL